MLHPRHTVALLKCFANHKAPTKAVADAQLKLYSEILPGDFLNYGFHDDPRIAPEDLSLHEIQRAQTRYGQLLIDQISDPHRPVLDAGCGMGGLLNLLLAQGFTPTALTPDQAQLWHIRSQHPEAELVEGKFESIPLARYRHHFGTVITSESFQYIRLPAGLATLKEVLAPGGRWILCDYFRTCDTRRRSGHDWDAFNQALAREGWKVVSERDITANVLPTVGYIHMWGERLAAPLFELIVQRLARKQPALHHLLAEVIEEWRSFLLDQLRVVDPEIFRREKKYMLMVIERR